MTSERKSRPSTLTLLRAYEYKVLTFDQTRGLGLGGHIKGDVLEALLNDHAEEGWRVVSCSPGLAGAKAGSPELVIVLERPVR